jgi:integral membrane protein (TIGR01906 family)
MNSTSKSVTATGQSWYVRLAIGLVVLLVPIALILTSVRLLLTPVFVNLEYRTPFFPPDPYGFSQSDRLYWSSISREYLLNDQGVSFLKDLRFKDGTPVFNERELRHMVDAKNVVQKALIVWYVALLGLLGLGLWAWRGDWGKEFRRACMRGGWLTIILVGVIVFFVLVSFGVFFVFFHEVFFDPGTWIFFYSDTLIRLFPERFWRDAFLAIGGLSIAGGLILALGLRPKSKS